MNYGEFNLNKNHHLHFGDEYNSMPVMDGNYPMIAEYLGALEGVIKKATAEYRRVFAFRFDLHFPRHMAASRDTLSNSPASKFVDSLKAKIQSNRAAAAKKNSFVHHTKVRYFWVREVGDLDRVHYHFVVFLNGYVFNWLGSYHAPHGNMANRVWEAWASALGETVEKAKPLVHFPENPSYMLVRDEPESVEAFFHRASYLCKARTKQYGFGHHGYGASRS
ncbi:inovirus Gp2 family protein [Ramlibacter alkalitolerans]|uniref:Inovirus Gp2 family protein n=1 Tax=Ramlibacter alkalitolerans TaxID=2039631 RepID=A0ABS1JUU7_9BURK|nr:inovirus Gp2 family protein [Ramlibacter alkalitolerans]MBL0427979.1 inovirus Gp2 family protein [Ramlibacter alkalitolerans]